MQTFLPYPDFEESAYALDSKRLGKQRVENLQILQYLFGKKLVTGENVFAGEIEKVWYDETDDMPVDPDDVVDGGHYYYEERPIMKRIEWPSNEWQVVPIETTGYMNHPAVKMWRGHEWSLLQYQRAICDDWVINGGYKDTCWHKSVALYFLCYRGEPDSSPPPWLGNEDFHRSHMSNLVRKDAKYYGPQFPGVPDNLPYIWPVD